MLRMARIKYIKDFYEQFTPRFLCTLEFEGHSSVGVNGHCVNSGQPELFVKLGEGVQFLHLKHESTDSFCLGFPCSFCSAEMFEPCLGFFIPLYKPIVPGGVYDCCGIAFAGAHCRGTFHWIRYASSAPHTMCRRERLYVLWHQGHDRWNSWMPTSSARCFRTVPVHGLINPRRRTGAEGG